VYTVEATRTRSFRRLLYGHPDPTRTYLSCTGILTLTVILTQTLARVLALTLTILNHHCKTKMTIIHLYLTKFTMLHSMAIRLNYCDRNASRDLDPI